MQPIQINQSFNVSHEGPKIGRHEGTLTPKKSGGKTKAGNQKYARSKKNQPQDDKLAMKSREALGKRGDGCR